jgi:hypothetical protein
MKARQYQVPSYEPTLRVVGRDLASRDQLLVALHWPYSREALEEAADEMFRRKHCLIRYIRDHQGTLRAIEGSHRLWVAHQRDQVVQLQLVPPDYLIQHDARHRGIVTASSIAAPSKYRGPVAAYRMNGER